MRKRGGCEAERLTFTCLRVVREAECHASSGLESLRTQPTKEMPPVPRHKRSPVTGTSPSSHRYAPVVDLADYNHCAPGPGKHSHARQHAFENTSDLQPLMSAGSGRFRCKLYMEQRERQCRQLSFSTASWPGAVGSAARPDTRETSQPAAVAAQASRLLEASHVQLAARLPWPRQQIKQWLGSCTDPI